MHVDWRFTGDGVLAFVGGALALIGVWWSNHQSVKNLKKQVETEGSARVEETERQMKAVAKAILFEIDDLYRYHLCGAHGYLEGKAKQGELPEVVRIPASVFAVYQGTTPRLGELADDVVEGVVHFYGKAQKYFALCEDFRAEREAHSELALCHPDNRKAATLFGYCMDSLPGLTRAAYIACERLSGFAGVEFKAPRLAIAAEDIAVLNRDTERIEHEEVHRI